MIQELQNRKPAAFDAFSAVMPELAGRRAFIVEDDAALARFLMRELALLNCSASSYPDGESALAGLEEETCDLLILDLNLPQMDGMEMLEQVRQRYHQLPILVLTARKKTEDRIKALERGADDCLIKPFSLQELLARLSSLLRRHISGSMPVARQPALVVNKAEHRVTRGSRKIELTPREFAILQHLMQNAGQPVSRMTLMREVWNIPFDPSNNIVDVYMKYLRDKIDHDGEPKLIRTVRGVGYLLNDD